MLHQLERLGPGADLLGDAIQLVVKDITKPFGKYQRKDEFLGRMNSLYLGASLAPRIEHAASQIHDSRDLLLFPLVAICFYVPVAVGASQAAPCLSL